jgi:gas vesicle protein
MNKSRFTIGAIIGAVAGIIAGILTAPRSGRETRADLKARAGELKNETELRAQEAKDQVDEYKNRGERAIHDAIDNAKNGFGEKK